MPVLIAREDAFLILRKWREDSALLSCRIKSPVTWVAIDGRIDFLDEEKVAVAAPDNAPGSGFSVSLEAARSFRFTDARDVPEERDVFESGLIIDFLLDGEEGLSFVAFCELKL